MASQLRFSIAERSAEASRISIPSAGRDINVLDYENMKTQLDDLHSPQGTLTWILLGYEGDTDDNLILLGSGSDSVESLKALLTDEMAAYGIVRVMDIVDGIPTHRYAYIVWMGERVPGVKKARIGTNKAAVNSIIGHYNVEILADKKSEITEEIIKQKVGDASGSRVRVGDVGTKKAQETTTTTAKSASSLKGQWGQETKSDKSLSFENLDEIKAAIKDVRDNSTPTNWMLLGYKGINKVALVGSGSGGVDEMRENLKPGSVNYAFLRLEERVDNTVQARFIHLYWIGDNVPPLTRGKVSTHKGALEELLSPFHMKVNATQEDEVTSTALQKRLQDLRK